MKQKILLSKRVPEQCLAPYEDRFEFTLPPDDTTFTYERILELLPQYDGYLDIDRDADKRVIDVAVDNGVKAIANYGVGYDRIDWKYATERGLPILNTPTSVTEATAELGATLIFSVMRGIARYDSQVRRKEWISPLFSDLNTMIAGSTLGIVGFGRIGKRVCRKAQGMGMKVVYYDQYRATPEVEQEFDVTYLPFDELLAVSDCVSLHAPYFPENHHMFNAETFIIGLAAGLLGIGVTVLLDIPINMIIEMVAGVKDMAAVPAGAGVVLVVISVVLTLIGGVIPSRMAAKKDPVTALRTE